MPDYGFEEGTLLLMNKKARRQNEHPTIVKEKKERSQMGTWLGGLRSTGQINVMLKEKRSVRLLIRAPTAPGKPADKGASEQHTESTKIKERTSGEDSG